jgi:hypothetical protein
MNSTVLTGYNNIFITTRLKLDINVRSVSLMDIDVRDCPTLHDKRVDRSNDRSVSM